MQISHNRGFSLVELLISISIISLLAIVALAQYSVSNDNLAVNSAAQEVALAIRQAQTYALAAREASPGTGQFSYGYGVEFDLNAPNSYYIFVDKNANFRYDVGNGCGNVNTECIEKIDLKNGVYLVGMCAYCGNLVDYQLYKTDIVFVRPNPKAIVHYDSVGLGQGSPGESMNLTFFSPKHKLSSVTVQLNGQITIP